MPKKRLPMQASTFSVGVEKTHGEEGREVGNEGIDGSIGSKILSRFVKGKNNLTPMETILIVPGELEFWRVLLSWLG
jgi:hypothetical protein